MRNKNLRCLGYRLVSTLLLAGAVAVLSACGGGDTSSSSSGGNTSSGGGNTSSGGGNTSSGGGNTSSGGGNTSSGGGNTSSGGGNTSSGGGNTSSGGGNTSSGGGNTSSSGGATPITRVGNPFDAVPKNKWYVDPVWSGKAMGQSNGAKIAGEPTAVWMDRIGAVIDPDTGLRYHLDEAVKQNAGLFMFVFYDLPNRDCAALASNGELRIADGGFQRYQDEYTAPIIEILSDPKYAGIHIVTILEVDSLPNLVTNADLPDCAEAMGPGGYSDGIAYAIDQLNTVPNAYIYLDIAHSGWLGWPDNFSDGTALIANTIKRTKKGVNSIEGFASNTANYTPLREPFIPDSSVSMGGMPIKSADFYEWNPYIDEVKFVQAWRQDMISKGFPSRIGMLVDTGRNGWGGSRRPSSASSSQDLNTFVNQSRIDRREHRGNWCNQSGGVGERPKASPESGIHAYVWIKPQGESDGVSTANFEIDPNDPDKKFDAMCGPNDQNRYDTSYGTGALPGAPHAGRWFGKAFDVLVENAYPPL